MIAQQATVAEKNILLTGRNPEQTLAYMGALLQKASWVKKEAKEEEEGRQDRGGRTERGEEQCEHLKLSEPQIELGLNPQVAVDKQ